MTRENEKKHATRIADMLLERMKDQGKVQDDATEEGERLEWKMFFVEIIMVHASRVWAI